MASKSEPRRREELNKIFSLTVDQLTRTLSYFSDSKIDTIRPATAKHRLSDFMDKDVAATLVRAICSMLFSERQSSSFDLANFIEGFDAQEDHRHELKEKKEILIKILRTEKASAISKAVFLSFESENIFNSISSVVDIRPIFNLSKTETIGNIIVPELKIMYFDRNTSENRSMTFCTDEEDLSKFADALSEVIRKIKILKSTLSKNSDEELYIVSGDTEL